MKRLSQILPVILAVALQVMPLLRNLLSNPALGSNTAFILRWGIGTGAALGAVDAVSGATTVYYTTPTNYFGTNTFYFTNNVAITNNKEGAGAYFVLSTATQFTPHLTNGMTTTSCIPAGLTAKVYDANNGNAPAKPIYCAIYGIPTTPVTNLWVHFQVGYPGAGSADITNFFTIYSVPPNVAPVITNHPVGRTNVAGANAIFSVTAGGTPTPVYQWRLLSTALSGATNVTLSLTNIRASQAGGYTVVITNAAGSVTSSVANLGVTNPLPATLTAPVKSASGFQFTFIPVVGLTNTVQTNSAVGNAGWGPLTNVPPPTTANPITVTDALGATNRFYRVTVQP